MTHIRLLSIVVFTVGACGPEYGAPVPHPPEVVCTPSLIDFNDQAVGDASEEVLQVHQVKGTPKIVNVWLSGEDQHHFHLSTPQLPRVLDRDEFETIRVSYEPPVPGWHDAKLHVTHTGADGGDRHECVVDVRGHAMTPELLVLPWSIDFGPVAEDTPVTRQVVVRNEGELTATVSALSFSGDDVFDSSTTFPLSVDAGLERVLSFTFESSDTVPKRGMAHLRVGDDELNVDLIANDCEQGDPNRYDADSDGFSACGGDCNDNDSEVHPGATEVWDGVDQDCDGIADEGTAGYDDDGDGFCEGPGTCTFGIADLDCVDDNVDVNPGADEIVDNGIDDDCDGEVDLGTPDGDGDGYAPDGGDCDDDDDTVHPGAPELEDWVDNDCDGTIDEGTSLHDDDLDGYCEAAVCSDGAMPGDCDDDTSDQDLDGVADGFPTHPSATELPDWRDNDCDGEVDEDTVNGDDDSDGYSEVGGDCDDTDPSVNPAAGCP